MPHRRAGARPAPPGFEVRGNGSPGDPGHIQGHRHAVGDPAGFTEEVRTGVEQRDPRRPRRDCLLEAGPITCLKVGAQPCRLGGTYCLAYSAGIPVPRYHDDRKADVDAPCQPFEHVIVTRSQTYSAPAEPLAHECRGGHHATIPADRSMSAPQSPGIASMASTAAPTSVSVTIRPRAARETKVSTASS